MRANHRADVWKRVQVGGSDECWPFMGVPNTYGYGQFRVQGKQQLAHRLVFALSTGTEPGAKFVCHSCDNRLCCNPAHLFLGTAKENYEDAKAKRRHTHGERSGTAKLSAADVREVRRLATTGESYAEIARRFGVTAENISFICQRRTWRHVA